MRYDTVWMANALEIRPLSWDPNSLPEVLRWYPHLHILPPNAGETGG